jgi:hypothetical protein
MPINREKLTASGSYDFSRAVKRFRQGAALLPRLGEKLDHCGALRHRLVNIGIAPHAVCPDRDEITVRLVRSPEAAQLFRDCFVLVADNLSHDPAVALQHVDRGKVIDMTQPRAENDMAVENCAYLLAKRILDLL